jgi:ABC-type multidrug transport system fused ATPase/permease subunit
MERFDRILLLRQGRNVESGAHQELVDLDGDYAAMWHAHGRSERIGDRTERLAC